MKNERGSDFFPSTKINGWKQKKKIANYVLPSAARALCSGSAGSASCIRHCALLPSRKSLRHHFPTSLKNKL